MNAPLYRRASATGENLTLANDHIRLEFYKRICGWGWAEIWTPDRRMIAVLDHFGELMVRDQEIPMRIEAADYTLTREGDTQVLTFPVATTMATQKLKGTSFEKWVNFPFAEPILTGEVIFTLKDTDASVHMQARLTSAANVYARYLRGVWLLAGEGTYGTQKTDSILPGIDWCIDQEWSSGIDFFKDPWANRSIPHRSKVTAPVMALSHDGWGIGVSWDMNVPVTRWFNYDEFWAQPVFATPNFIDRMNNSLLGLMIPDVKAESEENKPMADIPLEMHIGQHITWDVDLFITPGNSLDVMTEWVKKAGMPAVLPRWELNDALDRFANAYNTNLWHEGQGWGALQEPDWKASVNVPAFLRRYVKENEGSQLASELAEKIAWCDANGSKMDLTGYSAVYTADDLSDADLEMLRAKAEEILSWQKEDGSFVFEPDGRHYTKDDFRVARGFIEPMGLDGDTALHMNTEPAMHLLLFYRATGEEKYALAARRALDFALPYIRPEAGDYWETPLHAPNLLAAGVAMNVYYLAYELFGEEKYRTKAIYWLRSLIPFTHLWEPANVRSLYATKPCLCSSDWYFANWVRDHVQWEVQASFDISARLGFDWTKIDPEIDWHTFEKGIACASFHWTLLKETNTWRPHNIPASYDLYQQGLFDYCYADTHNTMTGNIGGMCIMPAITGALLYDVLDREAGK
ncbi:MAG: hypothetical protein IKC46_10385 [Lachnospiraceae bacterium]|nr:hypothetical protein [Lachnospiraceae bacterium]